MPSNYHPKNTRGHHREKLYREALRLELSADDLKKLREVARVHINKAIAGDMQAIKELADRLDGRPVQLLEHDSPDDTPVIRFVRQIVHVTETRENIDKEDVAVEYNEIKAINGNGQGD